MNYKKWKKRFITVSSNSARNIVPLIQNSLLSLLVIKYVSFSMWGEFVLCLLIFNLGAQLISWGNKQYLIREFAADPSKLGSLWFSNLKARFPLIIFFIIAVALLQMSSAVKTILILWQLVAFFSRSFEVVIIFQKKMRFSFVLESILTVLLLTAVFIFHSSVTILFLLNLFLLVEIIRLIISIYFLKSSIRFDLSFTIDFKILVTNFIFFILGLLGMLQSRLDMYFVAMLLSRNELAVYQVLINFILLIQSCTGFIIQPFLKEIYRMNSQSLLKFSRTFTLYGILLTVPIIFILTLIFESIYTISITWQMIILMFLYIIPIFYYTVRVYLLYKIKRESLILISGLIVLLLSVPINFYFIGMLKLNGALIAGVIGELLTLMFYYYFEKKLGLVTGLKESYS